MSHISLVHTLVKASGKKSTSVFFLLKFSLNFTSARPAAVLDFKLKSGALEPIAIMVMTLPIMYPVMAAQGFDPIWLGVVSVKLAEIGVLTPPVGLNVYNLFDSQLSVSYVQDDNQQFGQVWGRQLPRWAQITAAVRF